MRLGLTAAAVAAAIAASGCGGSAGDLIAIDVSGGFEGARKALVVTEDGRGRCNRGELRRIESRTLIDAREVQRDLVDLARDGARFEGPRAERRVYVARTRDGTVRWVEGAPGLPAELPAAARLALRLERELCR
jgi:hypothetical protein